MNVEISSTLDQLEEFKTSVIWDDIVTELGIWKAGFNDEMLSIVDQSSETNPSTASILLHMGDLNGRMKAVDYMINLIDVFISIKQESKK